MSDIAFWILTTSIIVLIGVIGFLLRYNFNNLLNKLTEVVDAINKVMNILSSQEEKNNTVNDKLTGHSAWLKEHEDRIRDIEIICKNCKHK